MGRIVSKKQIESSKAISSDGNSAEFPDMELASQVDFLVNVESMTGSPSLVITFQSAYESGGDFYDVQSFGPYDSAGLKPVATISSGIGKWTRLHYDFSGSGSITVSIEAIIKEDW